jgi:hypothetical protein
VRWLLDWLDGLTWGTRHRAAVWLRRRWRLEIEPIIEALVDDDQDD